MRHSLFVLALLAGLPAFGAEPARPAAPDLATAEVVDLTHPFDDKTLYWPNAPSSFQLTKLHEGKTPAGFFYAANSFCAPEHGGTHLDAPIHFAEGHPTADQVPVRQLIAPAVVIDVSRQASSDPDYRLTVADVQAWEARNGRIPAGAIVLLRTGWSSRWPDRKRYFGDDKPGDTANLHFPSYGKEAADLLIPGISNCRACHGGAYAKDKVQTTCIACHDYHQSATLKMGKL